MLAALFVFLMAVLASVLQAQFHQKTNGDLV
jgi:hypothetical protein